MERIALHESATIARQRLRFTSERVVAVWEAAAGDFAPALDPERYMFYICSYAREQQTDLRDGLRTLLAGLVPKGRHQEP